MTRDAPLVGDGRHVRAGLAPSLVVIALFVTSCVGPAEDPASETPGQAAESHTPAAESHTPAAAEAELDCEREGYPCSYAEVDPSVLERQSEYVERLYGILDSGTYAEALDWVRRQPDVIAADAGEYDLFFRLAGARPTVISTIPNDVDPVPRANEFSASLARASVPNAQSRAGSGLALARASSPGANDAKRGPLSSVVGQGTDRENRQNRKSALFLDPLSEDKNSGFSKGADGLRKIPDYQHADGVRYRSAEEVTPDSFAGWGAFDAIFVATHGGVRPGSWLLTGVYEPVSRDETRDEQCDWIMGEEWSNRRGVDCVHVEHNHTRYIGVAVFTDFFRVSYAPDVGPSSGLLKAIIYIGGCNGLLMTDIAGILAGFSSAYVGWTEITESPWWEGATLNLLHGLLLGYPVERAVNLLCDSNIGCRVPSTGAELKIFDNGPEPKKLRLYDLPTLRSPTSGTPLQDGAELRIRGTPGDGRDDQLEITVDLIGIVDPDDAGGTDEPISRADVRLASTRLAQTGDPASLYNLRFFADDRDIGADNLGRWQHPSATVTPLPDTPIEDVTTYRYKYTADLGFDVDPGGSPTTLKVEVDLREGGISDYEVDVVLMGVLGVCDLVEPAIQEIVDAFGEPLPLKEWYAPGGLRSDCTIQLEGPGDPSVLYAPDLSARIHIERLPAIFSSVSQAAQGFDGPVSPVPSLGVGAVVIAVPHLFSSAPEHATAHVLFEHSGRIWLVTGEYPDRFEIDAENPDVAFPRLELAETPVEAVVGVAEVVFELLNDLRLTGGE